MVAIPQLVEDFTTGPDGASVLGASIFTAANATGTGTSTFSSAHALDGQYGCLFPVSPDFALRRVDFGYKAVVWLSYYIKPLANAASNTAILNFYGDTTKIGDLRFFGGGTTLNLRSINTSAWTAANPLALNQWHRVAVLISPNNGAGVLRVRIYSGAQLHSTTPTEDSGNITATALVTSLNNVRMGTASVDATLTYAIDRVRGDDAAEPGPLLLTGPLTFQAATATGWVSTGGPALDVLSDADDGTYLTSSANPSGLVLGPLVLHPIEAPVGDFVVTVRASRVDASSASLVGTLRDAGGAVLATAAPVNPGTTVGDLAVTFPAASIAGVSQEQWRSGALRVQLAATAA